MPPDLTRLTRVLAAKNVSKMAQAVSNKTIGLMKELANTLNMGNIAKNCTRKSTPDELIGYFTLIVNYLAARATPEQDKKLFDLLNLFVARLNFECNTNYKLAA